MPPLCVRVCKPRMLCYFSRMKLQLPSSLLLLLVIVTAPTATAQTHPYTGMVSFGDSFSDVGNLYSLLPSATEKTLQHVTGWDPNYYYNYRLSNGPVWTDYLYTNLGFGAIGTMGANDGVNAGSGTNFAWVGSRSGTGTTGGLFPNLQQQIAYYSAQLGSNAALPNPATTLFTIWSGINDVLAHVENGDPVTPYQAASNISLAISTLYASGGRYFVVPNLPLIGQSPNYLNDPIKGLSSTGFVDLYNQQLNLELDALSASLAGISIIKVDVQGIMLEIMADYYEYGFTNVTEPAYIRFGEQPYTPRDPPYGTTVPDPDGYLYWDTTHFTSFGSFYIADLAYHAVMDAEIIPAAIPEPAVTALFIGGRLRFGAETPQDGLLTLI